MTIHLRYFEDNYVQCSFVSTISNMVISNILNIKHRYVLLSKIQLSQFKEIDIYIIEKFGQKQNAMLQKCVCFEMYAELFSSNNDSDIVCTMKLQYAN